MNDRLALLILQEVLPAVERYRTPAGVPIRLSKNPDDRAVAGGSTGGIAAFTVAWEHPEAFRRVFLWIGTFVGMRHGEQYYVQVRKTEPKPLRIFMTDNANDEWGGGPEMGDWFMSNLTMNRALEFAGYDVDHIWGIGTHSDRLAAAILPDAMKWLWKDWPKPLVAQPPGNPVLKQILQPGEDWHLQLSGCDGANVLAANTQGELFYGPSQQDQVTPDAKNCNPARTHVPFAFGNGVTYVARAEGGIELRESANGADRTVAERLKITTLTVRQNCDIYALTDLQGQENELWFIPEDGEPKRMAAHLRHGSGVALSPDGLWLFVSQQGTHMGMSYRVLKAGALDAG